MPDYDKATGGAGTMRMRDTGTTIQLWLYTSSGGTWLGDAFVYNYSSPHGSGNLSGAGYPAGSGWRHMFTITATASGTYSWTMPYTGTSAFGGPTTQTISISRGTVPPAPTPVAFSLIKHTSVRTTFNSNGTGGQPVLEWQIRFGTNGSNIDGAGNSSYSSTGTKDFTGLLPGQYYAAWARGRNSVGWGPWSSGRSFYTLAGCRIKANNVWVLAVPYVKVAGIWVPAVPYIKVDDVWKVTT